MDDHKVLDITLHRTHQLQKDPVLALADTLTRVLANHAEKSRPEDQLLALELSVKALLETLRHALGEVGLNEVIVELERKRMQYTIEWPAHDQSATVYDKFKDEPVAQVVMLRPNTSNNDEGNT